MSKRRFRKQKLPSEPVELEITSLSHEGRGIAHIDGKVAFVDGALAGETVTASYIRRRNSYDELRTEVVQKASPLRVTPPCAFAGTCGGCSLQHMEPAAQIEFKQSVLLEQMTQALGHDLTGVEILPNLRESDFHYRRKARLAARFVSKKGGALVGFREKYSSYVAEMDNCEVLVADVAKLILPLRALFTELDGKMEIPQIEVAVGESAPDLNQPLVVALVIRHLAELSAADSDAFIAFAKEHAVEIYLQSGGVDTVKRLWPLAETDRLSYFLPDFRLELGFHPMDFTQVNAGINRKIVKKALGLLELNKDDAVLDLFCGLGNFTLAAATLSGTVVGVEGSEEMVRRGGENAAKNSLTNTNFYAANLAKSFKDEVWAAQKYTKVILDPPRSGALEIIHEVAQLGAARIVYISCNPATLARDTAELVKAGYQLKSAGVMDMFPNTTHVESMAVFDLAN
jgi:23S rRNA (uracil1939-C5)-methyltransferase